MLDCCFAQVKLTSSLAIIVCIYGKKHIDVGFINAGYAGKIWHIIDPVSKFGSRGDMHQPLQDQSQIEAPCVIFLRLGAVVPLRANDFPGSI